MTEARQQLLDWIEADRQHLVDFLQTFVRTKSPNPPGDTKGVAAHISKRLDDDRIEYRIIDPHPDMPNIVASFDGGGGAGEHLVLNGHIDVFPAAYEGWSSDPWGGEIKDGKLYGRGAADMKAGTTASIFTYIYLSRLREQLPGKLTLTCVSDEETFGPYGARYLMDNHPEVHGDAMLNGEPGSPFSVRFGEKGPLWLRFTVRAKGVHGGYTHLSNGAIKGAMALAQDLLDLENIEAEPSHNVRQAIVEARETMDIAMGEGASEIIPKVTVNIGTIEGGLKVNMVPDNCSFETDIRLPIGVDKDRIMSAVDEIMKNHPSATVEEINFTPPNWCDPYERLSETVRDVVEELRGFRPTPIVSLGTTDTRLWRNKGIPAYIYGPFPHGMGGVDEHVDLEDFVHVVRTHVLTAYDYLTKSGG